MVHVEGTVIGETTTQSTEHVINGCTPLNAQDMADYAKDEERRTERQLAAQFQPGNKLGVGNKRGKAKLSGAFVADLTHEWNNRGCQALQDLTSKDLVQACIAILPKDVMMQLGGTDAVKWVISAVPGQFNRDSSDWLTEHGLQGSGDDKDRVGKGEQGDGEDSAPGED